MKQREGSGYVSVSLAVVAAFMTAASGCGASPELPGRHAGGSGGGLTSGGTAGGGGRAEGNGGVHGGAASGGMGGSSSGGAGGAGGTGISAPDAGKGGVAGTADAGAAPVLRDGPAADTRAGDGGSGVPDSGAVAADLLAACTPATAVVTVQDPNGGGGKIFNDNVPVPTHEAFVQAMSRQVCLVLYDRAADVKAVPRVTLIIDQPGSGVAYASGGTVHFAGSYIAGYRGDVKYEIHGVVAHEFTHVYQRNRGPGWLIEGMADYVRFKVGFFKLSQRRKGGNYNDSYRTTGFFIAWLDELYPGFGRKLNAAMATGATEATFQTLTGKAIGALWTDYQAAIP